MEIVAAKVLEAIRTVPENWDAFSKDYLASTGLKKMSDFYSDCMHVSVLLKDDSLDFMPMANHGKKGFLNLIPSRHITINGSSDLTEIAIALSEALALCE